MLILSIETPNHDADVLIVVLSDDSIERMAGADLAEVKLRECGKTLVNPRILICHEPDSPEFARLLSMRNLGGIVEYLQRGFQFRPDKGDHDGPPRLLSGDN